MATSDLISAGAVVRKLRDRRDMADAFAGASRPESTIWHQWQAVSLQLTEAIKGIEALAARARKRKR